MLHDIRHASLTWLLGTGATPRDVQIRSGHTILAALQRYLGIDYDRDEEVARRADERRRAS
ncbi:hypothetical protein BH10ACT6_BH10ACT6_01580 [soil metagenome]